MAHIAQIQICAGEIARFAVHDAGKGLEIDRERQVYNDRLRASIASDGVREPLLLDIDRARGQAQLANGNHRAVMAASINPAMMMRVNVREHISAKRGLSRQIAYNGEFDGAIDASKTGGGALC